METIHLGDGADNIRIGTLTALDGISEYNGPLEKGQSAPSLILEREDVLRIGIPDSIRQATSENGTPLFPFPPVEVEKVGNKIIFKGDNGAATSIELGEFMDGSQLPRIMNLQVKYPVALQKETVRITNPFVGEHHFTRRKSPTPFSLESSGNVDHAPQVRIITEYLLQLRSKSRSTGSRRWPAQDS